MCVCVVCVCVCGVCVGGGGGGGEDEALLWVQGSDKSVDPLSVSVLSVHA